MATELIVIEPASMQLARYDQMCHAIAEAHAIDEVRHIHNNVVAVQAYAHQARNFEIEQMAAEIRVRAEIRAGELLAEMKRLGFRETGRPPKGTKIGAPTSRVKLSDMGITRTESTKWQRLASQSLRSKGCWPTRPLCIAPTASSAQARNRNTKLR